MGDYIGAIRGAAIAEVLRDEGGYSDHPLDNGGKTKWGITEATARANGFDFDKLTIGNAITVYENKYWHSANLDAVATYFPKLARTVFNAGVNVGPPTAGMWLQRALNALNYNNRYGPELVVDGKIGKTTIAVMQKYREHRGRDATGERVLVMSITGCWVNHYTSLAERRPTQRAFSFGWIRRVISVWNNW